MKRSNVSMIVLLALAGAGYLSSAFSEDRSRFDLSDDNSMTSTSAPGCDPNYSGCVPIASDVDCAGRGGNGPAYVEGPVRVIGRDIYRLDGDGDGIGCE